MFMLKTTHKRIVDAMRSTVDDLNDVIAKQQAVIDCYKRLEAANKKVQAAEKHFQSSLKSTR